MVFSTKVMNLLPKEVIKIKSPSFNKMLVVLAQANQGICLQQACEQTGVFAHSKQILDYFKSFKLKEIQDFFLFTSLEMLKQSIPKLNLRQIKLAVDITEEDYYGSLDNLYIWNRNPKKAKNGTTGHFKYLTISCTSKGCKLILFNMLLGPGYQVDELIPSVLKEIKKIIHIQQVTFDRGFDNHKLVYELEKIKVNYIIFSKKNKATKKIFENIWIGESYSKIRTLKFYKLGEKYTCDAKFVYIKAFQFKETEEAYDWIFITNMSFKSVRHTIGSYRNRWGIETTFRVLKQDFRIKTCSKHQSVRLMCFTFSMLFYNIWQIAKYFISRKIKAKSFFETIRFGFKIKFGLKYQFEKEILDFFGLS